MGGSRSNFGGRKTVEIVETVETGEIGRRTVSDIHTNYTFQP